MTWVMLRCLLCLFRHPKQKFPSLLSENWETRSERLSEHGLHNGCNSTTIAKCVNSSLDIVRNYAQIAQVNVEQALNLDHRDFEDSV